jgi:hypothetical protein
VHRDARLQPDGDQLDEVSKVHVSAENLRRKPLDTANHELAADSRPTRSPVHLSEGTPFKHPLVQRETAHSERIFESLMW